jgi:flagellar biosynthesis protein FlhG
LNNAANLFLGVSLIYAGSLPYDEFVRKAMEKRVAIFQAYPNSKYSLAVQKIARAINKWPLPENPKGRLEFFFEYFMNKARKV